MRVRFGIKTLITFTTLFAVSLALTLPTLKARSFVSSFENQVDNRKLHWLEPTLRSNVHKQTESIGLTTIGCASYHPVLEPISVADILMCRRRIRLEHWGAWDPVDRDAAEKHLLALLENDFQSQPLPMNDVVIYQTLRGLAVIKRTMEYD